MAEGINMGRKSPWTKEEYVTVYNKVSNYANNLSAQLLREEGAKSSAEAIAAYNIYKCQQFTFLFTTIMVRLKI